MDNVVDIYLATHDRPYCLYMTLDALQKYTTMPHRIFVADNASAKENGRLLKSFKDNRRAITDYVRFPHNLLMIRDRLIEHFPPTAKYMVILDDDIVVQGGWLEALIDYIETYPKFGGLSLDLDEVDRPDPKNSLTPKYWTAKKPLVWSPRTDMGDIFGTTAIAQLVFTPTSLFKKIGGFVRDYLYSRDVMKQGYKLAYLKHPTVRHIGYNMFYDDPDWLKRRNTYFNSLTEHLKKQGIA